MPASGVAPSRAESRRLSWAVALLILAAITSSSLSALSLYHVLALQAEVEGLRTEVSRRREEQRSALDEGVRGAQSQQQQQEEEEDDRNKAETSSVVPTELEMSVSGGQQDQPSLKKRSLGSESGQSAFQPCLQMMADSKREVFQKEFALEKHTGVPWQTGLKRGSALEQYQDSILVKEEGYFFIYSQVYYKDSTFAMGHIVIRIKKNVVGDENQHVVLFRCIQSMNLKVPYNTCYTGGLVKLEVGDRLELLIPRSTANISLDGDSTYLGAIKLY
ncbi:tumor necrosis factor ligand superfamily member 13B isoform X1 [Astyanax mexicanus]|uniref:THD domain-containing protein n=1 Tax=Astyanax mexicanus TaxID=7994 RepID=A0A8B9J3R6_ASTMX|nr:tumor necrosis factor ligand superfamily member 13B isoform X1 [Astyanax mexicanus]XP_049341203.1 tumor necrosis factor ligand superfamily member 13B isoform X1 [Astyanax mexicanus]